MYSAVLLAHSWIRWIALVAAVGTVLAALRIRVPADRSGADRWSLFAMAALDLQMLLGLLLYLALSPFTTEAMKNMSAAMQNPQLRFWAVEHLTSMLVAIVLAHVGRVLARKATTPSSIKRRLLICFGLATILIIAGIPWPGSANGRPLFRL
jgi:heme A synthase